VTQRSALRLPETIRPRADAILDLTDQFCTEHLDAEYAVLCRKLVVKLARKRPSPLLRGDLRIWAAAVIYTIGQLNFLSERSQQPHLSTDDLSILTSVPKSTLANRSKLIRDTLKLRPFGPELQRRELIERNPLAWLILVNGILVDARTMPPDIQEEARRRGLIPDLSASDENSPERA
jgi:hypothetical protein